MKKGNLLYLTISALLSSAMFHAAAAENGFYVSGQLGMQNTLLKGNNLVWKDADGHSADNNIKANGSSPNLAGNIALGYQVDNNLRFEFAYGGNMTKTSVADQRSFSGNIQSGGVSTTGLQTSSTSAQMQTFMANTYYTFNTSERFTPFVMAGLGIAHTTVDGSQYTSGSDSIDGKWSDSFSGSGHLHGTKNNFAWNVGVGASYQLMPNLYVDAMLSYIDAGKVDVSGTAASESNADNTSKFITQGKMSVDAVNTSLGIRYVF